MSSSLSRESKPGSLQVVAARYAHWFINFREEESGGRKKRAYYWKKSKKAAAGAAPEPGSRVSHNALSGDQNKWIHPHNLLAQPLTWLRVVVFHPEKRWEEDRPRTHTAVGGDRSAFLDSAPAAGTLSKITSIKDVVSKLILYQGAIFNNYQAQLLPSGVLNAEE